MKFSRCCKLLQVFCFPPCCPRNIIEHAAFQPPPPSYSVQWIPETENYEVNIDRFLESNFLQRQSVSVKDIDFTYAATKNGTKIACMYFAVQPQSRTTILYSHGNASDLGSVIGVAIRIAKIVHCNVLAYDYSGYGRSTGKPSEKQIYIDIEAAFNLLLTKYGCLPEDIVLLGQSLGSAPTIDFASRVAVRGVVIQSGFVSALNVAFPREDMQPMCCDILQNIGKVDRVTAPALVIHGTQDEVVDWTHGAAIHERCPGARTVEPLWVTGAGHNDVEMFPQFSQRLCKFFCEELPPQRV